MSMITIKGLAPYGFMISASNICAIVGFGASISKHKHARGQTLSE